MEIDIRWSISILAIIRSSTSGRRGRSPSDRIYLLWIIFEINFRCYLSKPLLDSSLWHWDLLNLSMIWGHKNQPEYFRDAPAYMFLIDFVEPIGHVSVALELSFHNLEYLWNFKFLRKLFNKVKSRLWVSKFYVKII